MIPWFRNTLTTWLGTSAARHLSTATSPTWETRTRGWNSKHASNDKQLGSFSVHDSRAATSIRWRSSGFGGWRKRFLNRLKNHSERFCPGDLELHNVVVCTGPIQTFLMDFESSERAFSGPETIWEQRRSRDLFELLRPAIFLQCGLGSQQGWLARNQLRIYRRCLTMLPLF